MNREERSRYIGGTDLAHIFNIGKYYCERKLWFDKLMIEEDYPEDRELLFAIGHALEPVAKAEYIKRTGAEVIAWDLTTKIVALPYVEPHPDGMIRHPGRRSMGILECKTFSGHAWNSMAWSDGIPKAYIYQLQTYLWTSGLPWAAWACLQRETGQFLSFDIDKDERIIRSIQDAVPVFWAELEKHRGIEPASITPEIGPAGWQATCHDDNAPCARCKFRHRCLGGKLRASVEDLAERRRLRGDLPESEDEQLSALVAERDALTTPLKRAKEKMESLGDCIKARMEGLGHPNGVCLNGRKVTAYEQMRSSWDEAGMKADGVDVTKYKRPGAASRSLKVAKSGSGA